jgi:hypothetical protein
MINQRLQSGRFKDAEDVILQSLRASGAVSPMRELALTPAALAGQLFHSFLTERRRGWVGRKSPRRGPGPLGGRLRSKLLRLYPPFHTFAGSIVGAFASRKSSKP